jgi:UDP-3-O-[3-hydroxymyristoyl] glucosamine N-acyltransferase
MIIGNQKSIKIIGYPESSMTMEYINEISKTHAVEVISPEQLQQLQDPAQHQYIVAVWKLTNRLAAIKIVDDLNLDLITVIHNSVSLSNLHAPTISAGTFIFPFCSISVGAHVGKHCIIGAHSHVGHFCTIENNCQIRPGVMINGKSTLGNNCVLNTQVTVTNKVSVVDNVEFLAFTKVTKNIAQPGIYAGIPARKLHNIISPNDH